MGNEYKIDSFVEFSSNAKAAVDNILAQLNRIPKQINSAVNLGTGAGGGKLPSFLQAQKAQILLVNNQVKAQVLAQKNAAAQQKADTLAQIQLQKAQLQLQKTQNNVVTAGQLNQIKLQRVLAQQQSALQAQARKVAAPTKSTDLSAPYKKSNTEFKRLRNSINDVESEVGKLGFQAALTAKRFLAFAGVTAVFIGVSNAIRDGLTSAIAYEKQFAKISQVTGTSIKNLKELDAEITRLSTTLGVGSDSISEIALTLAQAGLSAKETTKALDVLAKTELAATFGDIKNTTEGAIAIMAQFKTGAGDLAAQLSTVNTVSAKFAVESEDLVEVIRKAGGAFQATGGNLNELLSLFTSVRATTRESAESISTGLRTIFTRLQRNRTVNFLSDLGVDLRDAKGEFIGIYPAVEKLSTALKDISGTDPRFNQIVEELGGFRQVSKVIPLLKEFETSQKVLSAARRAGNSVDRDAIIAQKTLANQFVRVREEFIALSRSYYNDNGIRTTISLTLNLASALIKVADAVRPLVPLIGTIALGGLFKSANTFVGGAIAQNAKTVIPRKPFSSGGPVPGSGNGDTVPASLTPGEFVIRKSAAKAFGMGNLHKINRYAGGGRVGIGVAGFNKLVRPNFKRISTIVDEVNSGKFSSDILSYIPKGSKHLSTGTEGIALETPDGKVIRLGLLNRSDKTDSRKFTGRVKDTDVLQPNFSRKFGKVLFEELPKAETFSSLRRKGVSVDELDLRKQKLVDSLDKRGIDSQDLINDNFGRYNNKDYVIDPGSVVRRYANGGIVEYLKKSRRLSKAQGLGSLFGEPTAPGPKFGDQLKDLFAKGGFRRSLGIGRKNQFFGDANYTSVPRQFIPASVPEPVRPQLSPLRQIEARLRRFEAKQKRTPASYNSTTHVPGEPDTQETLDIIGEKLALFRKRGLINSDGAAFYKAEQRRILTSLAINAKGSSFRNNDFRIKQAPRTAGALDLSKFEDHEVESALFGRPLRKLATPQGQYIGGIPEEVVRVNNTNPRPNRYSFSNLPYQYILGGTLPEKVDTGRKASLSRRIKRKYFADGGGVGGSGNSDNVPALLTPGEFVINKRSAQAFGYNNLAKVNKYATGGVVGGASTALIGAQVGGQLVQGLTGEKSSEEFKSFINSLSTAGGALLLFALTIKKDTTSFGESTKLLEDSLKTNKTNLRSSREEFSQRVRDKRAENAAINTALSSRASGVNGAGLPTRDAITAQQELVRRKSDQAAELNKAGVEFKTKRREIQEKNAEINNQIKLNTANEKAAVSFNKLSNVVSGLSTSFIFLGTLLDDANQRLAAQGKQGGAFGFGTVNEARFGGGLTGAGIGAAAGLALGGFAGSFAGPGGTVLGAKIGASAGTALGGIAGGVNSGLTAQGAIDNFEVKKSFEELERVLTNLQAGRTTAKGASFTVNQSAGKINSQFFKLSGDQFDTFRGAVENSITGIEAVFNENLKAATSVKNFTDENKELITVLTRFGGVSIPELEKKIQDEVAARNKAIKAETDLTNVVLDNARRLEATFAITSALTSAESAVHTFGDALDKVAQIANGSFSDKSNFNFSGLSDIANANPTDLRRQANQVAGFVGGPAQGIANDVGNAGAISQRLPSILNDLVLRKQLDGDDLLDELKTQLGKGFSSGLILEAVKKEIGNTGDTTKFLQKFREDPIGITKNIQASLQPLAQALADAAPRITQQFDEFADGLAAARENFLAALSGLTKSVDIAQVGREFNLASTGRPLGFAESRGFDRQRENLVTGGRGVGQLAGALGAAQGNIVSLTQARQQTKDAGEFKRLTEAISENIKEVQVSTRALDYLADVNSRLSTVEKERSRQQQIREAKTNLAKSFAFGDPAAQQEIVKGLVGVTQILQVLDNPNGGDPLGGLNNELKQNALSIFEQNSDNDIFGGFTGKERINQILQRQGFNVQPGQAENDAIAQGNQIIEQAKAAQEVLNANVRDTNEFFLKGLGEKFDGFFVNLEKFFKDEKAQRDKGVNDEIDARKGGIDNQIGAINRAKARVGLGANDPLDLINKNADTALKIGQNREDINRANKAFQRIKGQTGGNVIPDVTGLIREALPAGDERNALEKKIFDLQNATTITGEKLSARFQNPQIEQAARDGIDKYTTRLRESTNELRNNLGVDNSIKEQFIQGAKEAVEILKKSSIKEDVPALIEQKKALEATRRASGGSVFTKRGSDTVPAMTTDGSPYMLTPGEFVMNRRAVASLGVGTLNKLNRGYLASGGRVPSKGRYLSDKDYQEFFNSDPAFLSDPLYIQAKKDKEDSRRSQAETAAISQRVFGTKEGNQAAIAADKAKLAAIQADKTPVTDSQDRIAKFLKGRRASDIRGRVSSDSVFSATNRFDNLGNLKIKSNTFTPEQQLENAKRARSDAYISKGYRNRREAGEKFNPPGFGQAFQSDRPLSRNMQFFQDTAHEVRNGGAQRTSFAAWSRNNPEEKPQSPINQPQAINPKLMEDFVRVVDKLAGTKLELAISGTLNVNLNSPNLSEEIVDKFRPVIVEYVDNEINKAVNKLIGDASLGIPPRSLAKKESK